MLPTGSEQGRNAGADVGLQAEDPTIAELLKPLAMRRQFGKNHLGDRNELLPTAHGFDEFFGNLYHLNAEESRSRPNYPPAEDFPVPRALCAAWRDALWATDTDDDTTDQRWGRVGKQRIEDTGPLTKKRMETIDDEFLGPRATSSSPASSPARHSSCWFNTTHMHFRTHTKPESLGQAGRWQSAYHDTKIDHDKVVG